MKQIHPRILTLITTHACTSSCNSCCYDCSPSKTKRMSYSEISQYVTCCVKVFPTIKTVVFTGGECTLLGNDLFKAIELCSKMGLNTRVVTNGFWAKNKIKSKKHIDALINAGLNEINFSTGDSHQEFVPFENILNALAVLIKTNFRSILVTVEEGVNKKFNINNDIIENPNYASLGKGKERIILVQSPWVEFADFNNPKNFSYKRNDSKGCESIFNSININPNGQLLSCCGLAAEYSSVFKLGKFNAKNIDTVYANQFNDLFKLWIYTKGPLEIIKHTGADESDYYQHPCALCLKILTNRSRIEQLISKNNSSNTKKILVDFNLKLNNYEN